MRMHHRRSSLTSEMRSVQGFASISPTAVHSTRRRRARIYVVTSSHSSSSSSSSSSSLSWVVHRVRKLLEANLKEVKSLISFLRKRRKTTATTFCRTISHKKKQIGVFLSYSSIRVERRQRRRSQEKVKKKSFSLFSLSLPLFVFVFLLAIDTKSLRAAEIRYTVIYIIQLILFWGKPPPSVTFDKRPTTRTMTSTTISSLSSRLISSLLSSSSTSSSESSRRHFNNKNNNNRVFKIENAGKKSAFRLSNNKRKAKKTKQEEKDEMKRAFDGEGLSPEERVSGAKHKARRWLGQHFLIDH